MADRFYSINSGQAIVDHLRQYWITEPITGVNLKLDIIGDETLTAESDVTDHYVESNIAYQDQISIKPKTYTVQGEVGELVWYQKDTVSQRVGQVAQRLEGVVSFLPIRSRSFQQMKKKVMKAAQWVDTASNVLDRFDTLTPEMTNQQQAYNWLISWMNIRLPITIESPWGVLQDYVITSLNFTQPRETKDKSIISISFKEFRTTSVSTVKFDPEKYQNNAALENEPESNSGRTDGEDKSIEKESITDEDGNFKEVCSVRLDSSNYGSSYEEKYGTTFSVDIVYNKKDNLLQVLDRNGDSISRLDSAYWDAIDNAVDRCGFSIGDIK